MIRSILGTLNLLILDFDFARYNLMGQEKEVNGIFPSLLASIIPSYGRYKEAELESVERIESQNALMDALAK